MKNILKSINLFIIVLIHSCSPLEDPEFVPPEEILRLSVEGDTILKADGADQTILVARIPRDAGELDVNFKTTGGFFIYSAAKEIKVFTDSSNSNYRYATTILQSDTISRQVYISAEIAHARRRITLSFK